LIYEVHKSSTSISPEMSGYKAFVLMGCEDLIPPYKMYSSKASV